MVARTVQGGNQQEQKINLLSVKAVEVHSFAADA